MNDFTRAIQGSAVKFDECRWITLIYKMRLRTCFLSIILACGWAWADQVTLKNGDRLTGSLVRFDGKNVMLKSELAGEVTMPWDAITSLSTAHILYVGLKDGQVI